MRSPVGQLWCVWLWCVWLVCWCSLAGGRSLGALTTTREAPAAAGTSEGDPSEWLTTQLLALRTLTSADRIACLTVLLDALAAQTLRDVEPDERLFGELIGLLPLASPRAKHVQVSATALYYLMTLAYGNGKGDGADRRGVPRASRGRT